MNYDIYHIKGCVCVLMTIFIHVRVLARWTTSPIPASFIKNDKVPLKKKVMERREQIVKKLLKVEYFYVH